MLDTRLLPAVKTRTTATSSSTLWWGCLIGAWCLLCLPLFLVDIPPLADYPNHLARMVVLSRLGTDASLQEIYEARWGIIPDLAIDSFMPYLVAMVPPVIAGKILLAGIMLLDIVGVTACATALHGRRTWWSLGSAIAAHNIAFLMGFMNFDVACALAMVFAAGWMQLRKRSSMSAAIFGLCASGLLFFCHLMGLFFFLMLVASFEASQAFSRMRAGSWRAGSVLDALRNAWPSYPAILPPCLLYPLTGLRGATGDTDWLSWNERLTQAMGAVINYNYTLDVGTACCVIGFVVTCAALRCLRMAPGAVFAVLIIGGLYPVLPHDLKGTGFVDTRLAVMLGFLVFMAFNPRLERRLGLVVFLSFATLFIGRVGVLASAWSGWRQDEANIEALAALVQPSDRMMQISVEPEEVIDYWTRAPTAWRLSNDQKADYHVAAWYFFSHGAWWPYLFANPDQQPMAQRQPYKALGESLSEIPGHDDMVARRAAGNQPAANPYCGFDKLLMMAAWAEPHPETLSPDWLELMAVNRTAALYRVKGIRPCHPPAHG